MLTSWSEVSTPAELSMKSVLTRPPASAYSTLASWVRPRLPPSPMTLARTSDASTRTASLDRSPTSAFDWFDAFTYVPMPPFHSRSTGADRIAEIRLSGDIAVSVSGSPSTARTWGVSWIDLTDRGKTPPPADSSAWS